MFRNASRKKYLILLPVVVLLLNSLYFLHATREIQKALLQEKYVEIVNAIDMLGAAVEATPERHWLDHESNIHDSVVFLDSRYQVYGSAYKMVDGQYTIITERFYETSPFTPFEFSAFRDAVATQESGHLIIGYTPENQSFRELHLYFRWMPTYSSTQERFLLVAGVSRYSITANVSLWVSAGQWIGMLVTFVLNVWLIMLLARIGPVYALGKMDEPQDKQRH